MATTKTAEKKAEKTYRTLTELMAAPAGESLETIARVAAPIERIISGTGAINMLVDENGVKAESMAAAAEIIVNVALKAIGDYMPECKEILAAVNGITVAQLEKDYTGFEVVKMINVLVRDQGFLSSLRMFTE